MTNIAKLPEVVYFLDNLPKLIKDIFGDSKITMRVYQDCEESWQNLLVNIKPRVVLYNTNTLEEKFFANFDKDNTLISALEHVTITWSYPK